MINLTQKEIATVVVLISEPQLTIQEQADKLGVAPKTLRCRHERIADKFGTATWAGAMLFAQRMIQEQQP